jgi:hypothetical protein
VARRTRLQVIEALEQRALLSAMGAVPLILNGDTIDDDDSDSSSGGVARIVNGTPTNGFPSVGEVGDRFGGFCSGTLIAPQYVLTAGHCADDLTATAGRFFVGGDTYTTSQVFVHPNYNGNRIGVDDAANDIAIFQLNRPVDGVTPSEIFRGTPRVGQVLTLVGFGAGGTGAGHNGDFGTKRVGATPIDGITPRRILWTFDNNSESNTAPGDSGGPAFLTVDGDFQVAGVTSGGSRSNAGIGDRSFDTRVDFYATWIDSVLGNEPPPPPPPPGPDDHVNELGDGATVLTVDADGGVNGLGVLEETGDRDVFQIDVTERSNVTLDLNSVDASLDTFLRVFDEAGNLVAQNDDFGGTTDSHLSVSLRPGLYFISAGSYLDGGAGAYTLTGQLTLDDHGDTSADATSFQLGTGDAMFFGTIGHAGDRDVFRFVAGRSGTTTIELKADASNLDPVLSVYDARGRRIAFNDDSGGTTDSRVQVRLRSGATYFVEAAGYGTSTGKFSARLTPIAGRSRGGRNALQLARSAHVSNDADSADSAANVTVNTARWLGRLAEFAERMAHDVASSQQPRGDDRQDAVDHALGDELATIAA